TRRNPRAPACAERGGLHVARSARGGAGRRPSHHPLGRRARLVARSPRRRISGDRQCTDRVVSLARKARRWRADAGRDWRGAPRPAAIVGIPVGFVGAAEAKDALAAASRGVPFLTVLGRMGGSAMAAAAVNALARDGI